VSSANPKDDKSQGQSPDPFSENEIGPSEAGRVAEDDPQKVEKLTKAGRDLDPDEGTE
jgi:hypothetical protein